MGLKLTTGVLPCLCSRSTLTRPGSLRRSLSQASLPSSGGSTPAPLSPEPTTHHMPHVLAPHALPAAGQEDASAAAAAGPDATEQLPGGGAAARSVGAGDGQGSGKQQQQQQGQQRLPVTADCSRQHRLAPPAPAVPGAQLHGSGFAGGLVPPPTLKPVCTSRLPVVIVVPEVSPTGGSGSGSSGGGGGGGTTAAGKQQLEAQPSSPFSRHQQRHHAFAERRDGNLSSPLTGAAALEGAAAAAQPPAAPAGLPAAGVAHLGVASHALPWAPSSLTSSPSLSRQGSGARVGAAEAAAAEAELAEVPAVGEERGGAVVGGAALASTASAAPGSANSEKTGTRLELLASLLAQLLPTAQAGQQLRLRSHRLSGVSLASAALSPGSALGSHGGSGMASPRTPGGSRARKDGLSELPPRPVRCARTGCMDVWVYGFIAEWGCMGWGGMGGPPGGAARGGRRVGQDPPKALISDWAHSPARPCTHSIPPSFIQAHPQQGPHPSEEQPAPQRLR